MRIIWKRDLDRLLQENLTPEELQSYERSFEVEVRSFQDMRRQSDMQVQLLLKAIGCRCLEDVLALRDECMPIIEALCESDVSQYEKVHFEPPYREALARLARKRTRKKQCHMNARRGFTCYCDEHNHAPCAS